MKAASLHPQPGTAPAAPNGAAGRAARRLRAARRERRPWTVKATLRAAFAILLAGTLAIGMFSLWQISRLNASIASVYEQGHVASRAAEEVRAEVLRASRAQKMLLTATTAKERDELGAEVGAGLTSIGQALGTLQRYADPADADDSARLHSFSTAVGTWSAHLRDFVELVRAQPLDLSQMNWQVGTQDVSLLVETGKLEKIVAELVKTRGAKSKATLDASATIFSSSFAMIAAMTVALIVLAIVIAERVVRRLASQLGGEPAHAKAIAADIARGDLTRPIKLGRHDRDSMVRALAEMQTGLAATVGEIAVSAEAIAAASGEISTGNLDLSKRTEQQAVALERTAASMEQLTSTVRQNAENARQASSLAANASAVAETGGEVVGRVVATMSEIDDSAKNIRDIIGTIEGIAFQTNILALNAAVEAARAGEQGRGFS
ncbi:methyl-accepting chemotaxis protein, partial [Burkholderia sp. Se-20378]|uniref:methyl-accepting chemotaxis protein n=1 Tax=Burkholderia sp. Se-20378 TaxID=2703899 RepID=UPI00198182AB